MRARRARCAGKPDACGCGSRTWGRRGHWRPGSWKTKGMGEMSGSPRGLQNGSWDSGTGLASRLEGRRQAQGHHCRAAHRLAWRCVPWSCPSGCWETLIGARKSAVPTWAQPCPPQDRALTLTNLFQKGPLPIAWPRVF